MAVTLTSSWQTIATAQVSYVYEYSYTWTIALQARYSNQSGNSATVRVRAVITNNSAQAWYGTNKGYNVNNNGYVQYTETVNGGASFTTTEYTAGTLSGGASKSLSGNWSVMGTYSATASETVTMPQFIIAPTTPTLTIVNNNAHQNTISYGTSSYGYPSTGNIKLYKSTDPTFSTETLLETKTTTGLFTYVDSGLTANTTYYYRTIATNGSASSPYVSGNTTTRRAVYVPTPNDPEESNETALVQNLLVPYNGLSRTVLKLYRGNADDEAERIY